MEVDPPTGTLYICICYKNIVKFKDDVQTHPTTYSSRASSSRAEQTYLEMVLLLAHERVVRVGEVEALVGVHAVMRSRPGKKTSHTSKTSRGFVSKTTLTIRTGSGRTACATRSAGTG